MAVIDENGMLYILGRISDKMTLENGDVVYLFDIATEFKKSDFVTDAIVLPMPTDENKYNLVAHIVWNDVNTKEERKQKIEVLNSIINEKFSNLISIGGYFEHDEMLPYSPTTLKKDRNGMSHQLEGYINVENSEIVDVDYTSRLSRR